MQRRLKEGSHETSAQLQFLSSRPLHTMSEHAEALQATASEGLAQGPYVAARAGFEPTTLRSKGIDSTNVPPRPTRSMTDTNNYPTRFYNKDR